MVLSTTVINCLFIIPLIIIGVVTSYSDIRFGKIKNSHIRLGYIYIMLLYLFLAYYSLYIVNQPDNLKYLSELLINGTIAFVVGYLLWYFNLWAAGDAKLFPLYSLLIPMEFYFKNHVPNFPSLVLLTDTFIIICLALFLKILLVIIASCFKYLKRPFPIISLIPKYNKKTVIKAVLSILKLFVFTASLLIVIQFIMVKIPVIQKITIFQIPIAYLLFFPLQMFFSRTLLKYKIAIIIVCLGGVLCSTNLIISGQTNILIMAIKMAVLFMLILSLVMQLVNKYIDQQEIKKISINKLSPGNFLAPQSLELITTKIRQRVLTGDLYLSCSDGLSKSQIKTIKKLFRGDPNQELYICHTFPFAPFMFLASLFILIYKGSLLFFLL